MYIEELAHGSPFLDLQNFFSQEGVRLGEQTCLFAGSSSALSGEADHN